MYRIVWQFAAEPDRVAEFEREYGRDGVWARLFRGGEGYLGTELFRSLDHPARFVTVDRWSSRAAYDAFRAAREQEYAAVDRQCERLTRAEELVARGEEP
jgi:heme-degrading monooxygenase HmoA